MAWIYYKNYQRLLQATHVLSLNHQEALEPAVVLLHFVNKLAVPMTMTLECNRFWDWEGKLSESDMTDMTDRQSIKFNSLKVGILDLFLLYAKKRYTYFSLLGQFPGQLPPGLFPPDNSPWTIPPRGQLPPGLFPPG
jgi:hypothetical protein